MRSEAFTGESFLEKSIKLKPLWSS